MYKVHNLKNMEKKKQQPRKENLSDLFQPLISLFTEGATVYQSCLCNYKYYLLYMLFPHLNGTIPFG